MRAAIYPGGGRPLVIAQLPDPQPGVGELLIRVHRCGVCGTDLAMTRGGQWDFPANGQLGHEYAGEVIDVGAHVEGFCVGNRIAVLPSEACGHCRACDHGNNTLCGNAGGLMRGFAEYAVVPAAVSVRLPSVLSMADGALVEPLAVSLYGVRQSALQPGQNVLVLGGGTVAQLSIYWARQQGAGRIVAMSRSASREALSLTMGADAFVPFGDQETTALADAMQGQAIDVVYECVGVEGMLARAVRHVAPFGRIVSLGFCTAPDPVIPALASYKCATLQYVVGYTLAEFEYVANHIDKGHVRPDTIVTRTAPLSDLPLVMNELRQPNADTKVQIIC